MHTGGCLCGSVRYESSGDPLFSLICHCRDCQKASGTAGVPVMGVSKAQFKSTGLTKVTSTIGGSGRVAVRHFCASCGSLLFGTPEVAPEIVTVYAGTLDAPEEFHPDSAIFVRSRPSWAKLAEELTEFEGLPE